MTRNLENSEQIDIDSPISSFITEVESFWFVDNLAYRRRSPRIHTRWGPKLVEEFCLGTANVKRYSLSVENENCNAEVNIVDGDG